MMSHWSCAGDEAEPPSPKLSREKPPTVHTRTSLQNDASYQTVRLQDPVPSLGCLSVSVTD